MGGCLRTPLLSSSQLIHKDRVAYIAKHQTDSDGLFLLSFFPLSKLPSWARAVVPKIFYVTEKAWNYYPYTITGKSFVQPVCYT